MRRQTNFDCFVEDLERDPEVKASLDEWREYFAEKRRRDDDDGSAGVPVRSER